MRDSRMAEDDRKPAEPSTREDGELPQQVEIKYASCSHYAVHTIASAYALHLHNLHRSDSEHTRRSATANQTSPGNIPWSTSGPCGSTILRGARTKPPGDSLFVLCTPSKQWRTSGGKHAFSKTSLNSGSIPIHDTKLACVACTGWFEHGCRGSTVLPFSSTTGRMACLRVTRPAV